MRIPEGSAKALATKSSEYRAHAGGLLDDRPRRLLPLVPLVGGRADHVLGEVVDPSLDLQLVLVQLERELRRNPRRRVGRRRRGVAAQACVRQLQKRSLGRDAWVGWAMSMAVMTVLLVGMR